MTRYKDIVYCWDVVNEAITDDPRADNYPLPFDRDYQPKPLYRTIRDFK